jgi:hypothetical protein
MLFLALYQGTTLVGPQSSERELGFSPCCLYLARKENQGLKESA